MSASFYISSTSPDLNNYDSDLKVNLDEFVTDLKSQWSDINIEFDGQNDSWLFWDVNKYDRDMNKDHMYGEISPDRKYVYVDAHSKRQTVAKFAIWYRKLVPTQYKLFIGASWGGHFELTLNMQLSEVLKSIDLLENHSNV